jgi:hypothetical protein
MENVENNKTEINYKFKFMLKQLGIKVSYFNSRVESIFLLPNYDYYGFYLRYLNEDTNKEEIAKISVDVQKQNFNRITEIYKGLYGNEQQNLRDMLKTKFGFKEKDIFFYASYPVNTRFITKDQTEDYIEDNYDTFYLDLGKNKLNDNLMSQLGINKELFGKLFDTFNFTVSFNPDNSTKGYYMSAVKSLTEFKSIFNLNDLSYFMNTNNLIQAFDVLSSKTVAETDNKNPYMLCGFQLKPVETIANELTASKFIYSAIKNYDPKINYSNKIN